MSSSAGWKWGATCHIAVTNESDAGASLAALPDEVCMPWAVQDARCHIPAERIRHPLNTLPLGRERVFGS